MFAELRAWHARQQFDPGPLGTLVNPFYFARRHLIFHIRQLAPAVRGRVLDVGCGQKPYRRLFVCDEYVGLEPDSEGNRSEKKADVFYDGDEFPFDDHSFDTVVTFQVFEHVFNPDRFLHEIARVVKPGGMLLLTVPFVWDEHEQPIDYARYSSFGLSHLVRMHGFEVVEFRKTLADVRVLFQLFNAYFFKMTTTRNAWINLIVMVALMAPINIFGEVLAWLMPSNEDLFLDSIVLARRCEKHA
jgi:SAM-dependent methyltransferase